MGQMVNGVWETAERAKSDNAGAFLRPSSVFRDHITPGGRFAPEPGRYHLTVSLACPWAHRTLIFRKLKGLEQMIGLSVTHWIMADQGWSFEQGEGVIADPEGARAVHDIYRRADAHYTGRGASG